MKKVLSVVGCWICACWLLYGQQDQPFIHHLTVEQGLSEGTNEFIYKDRKGFVWISSISGVNRFDGRSVRVYQPRSDQINALFGQNVQGNFFEQANYDLWFTTYEGINHYVRSQDDFEHFTIPDSIAGKAIGYMAFYLDAEEYLWFLISGLEVCRFHIPTGKFDHVASLHQVAHRANVLADKNGRVQKIFTYNFQISGLEETSLGTKGLVRNLLFNKGERKLGVKQVLPENDTSVWLATNIGLYRYNPANGQSKRYDSSQKMNVNSVAPFGDNELLLAIAEQGLVVVDKKNNTIARRIVPVFRDAHSLSSANVDRIYTDRDGGIWLTLQGLGVDYFFPKKQKFHALKLETEGLDFGMPVGVAAFVEDNQGRMWCATDNAGINILDENNRTIEVLEHRPNDPNSIPSNNISYLLRDQNDRIWVMTWEGIAYYMPEKRQFRRVRTGGLTFIYGHQLQDGRILLSCLEKGIYELVEAANGEFSVKRIDTIDDSGAFTTLWQDGKGRLFACWEVSSIRVMLPDQDFRLVNELQAPGESDAFYENPADSSIWVANSYGLLRFTTDLKHRQIFGESHGLPDQVISGLLPSSDGLLWLSTNRGLASFNPTSLKARSYSLPDGLASLDFSRLAFSRRKNGELWFGASNGITYFRPEAVQDIEVDAAPVITHMMLNDQEVEGISCAVTKAQNFSEIKQLKLSWLDNTLSFSFAALEYSDPANTRFRYMMEGVDRDWVESGTKNFARYANLEPGNLTFRVMASNSDGKWSDVRTLRIFIKPPFWQTWWFYLLMAALAFAMGWAIATARRRKREEKRIIEEEKRLALDLERQRIARDVHDDLGSGLSALSLLTEMAKFRSSPEDLKSEIDKINRSARDLSGKIREVIWTVSAKNDTLANLISYLQQYVLDLTEQTGLECQFNLPEIIPEVTITGEHRRTTFLAFKEALNNVTKHAGATTVEIDISVHGNLALISIADDGKGFDPRLLLESTGNGLINMRARMRDIGGKCEFKTDQQGTKVSFSLPFSVK